MDCSSFQAGMMTAIFGDGWMVILLDGWVGGEVQEKKSMEGNLRFHFFGVLAGIEDV